jgi:hypothetical protein
MTRAKIFIASSSEGLKITNAICRGLAHELGDAAEVEPWTRKFDLSATYIESLESAVEQADFAILVLSPDDVTTSRKQKSLAPRDNVIFELGLFMGQLGRERCYMVRQDYAKLKVPTDLLGVKSAAFSLTRNGNWRTALEPICTLIAERVARLGIRPKFTAETLGNHLALGQFAARVSGTWWERIQKGGVSDISLFAMEFDDATGNIGLEGRSYSLNGAFVGLWKSELSRAVIHEKKLQYHWKGWLPAAPQDSRHGFGEMVFDGPAQSTEFVNSGQGKFWDINETHPKQTSIRAIELKRPADATEVARILKGKEREIRALIKDTLRRW